jgi:hypothetical protein
MPGSRPHSPRDLFARGEPGEQAPGPVPRPRRQALAGVWRGPGRSDDVGRVPSPPALHAPIPIRPACPESWARPKGCGPASVSLRWWTWSANSLRIRYYIPSLAPLSTVVFLVHSTNGGTIRTPPGPPGLPPPAVVPRSAGRRRPADPAIPGGGLGPLR